MTSAEESMGLGSYQNWPLRRATGWDVTWRSYSGSGRRTDLAYQVGSRTGIVRVGGAPYEGGVVLADPRSDRALCVSQLVCTVKPGPDGNYAAGLSVWGWISVTLTLAVVATLSACAAGALVALLV